MEVEIELNKKNYFVFFLFDFLTHLQRIRWIFILLLFCILFVVIVLKDILLSLVILLPTVSLLLLLGIIFKLIEWIDLTNKYIKNKLNTYGLLFKNDTFISRTRIEERELKATTILEAVITKQYIFLYVDDKAAIIIPKSQLNEGQHNDIIQFLNNNHITIKQYSWY